MVKPVASDYVKVSKGKSLNLALWTGEYGHSVTIQEARFNGAEWTYGKRIRFDPGIMDSVIGKLCQFRDQLRDQLGFSTEQRIPFAKEKEPHTSAAPRASAKPPTSPLQVPAELVQTITKQVLTHLAAHQAA